MPIPKSGSKRCRFYEFVLIRNEVANFCRKQFVSFVKFVVKYLNFKSLNLNINGNNR